MRTPTPSRGVSWYLILLVAILAAVLIVPAGLVAASGPSATLRGFITAAGSTTPVAGATVQVAATTLARTFQATTDASGSYAVSLPNDIYNMKVSSPAFYLNTTTVRVGSGQTVWMNMSLTLAASRSAVLEGYVKDASTSAAITVGFIVLAPPSWASNPQYRNTSGMDATGFYRMNMTPGTYVLTTDSIVGYAPYSYSYVYLNAGQARWLNLSLTAAPLVAWINGTAENANNYSHLAGVTITATVGGLQIASTTSNATGSFSIQSPVATVQLIGDAPGFAPDQVTMYIYFAGAYSANVYLTPLSTGIRGYVRNAVTGAVIPGTLVVPTPIFSGGYNDQAATDASGYFAIPLISDDYSVSASPAGYAPWYSYVYLSAGTVVWTNVTLWPLISTLRGYLIDGTTAAHVPGVGLYAYDSRTGYSASATSDVNGAFSLTLPPSPAITLRVYGYPPYAGTVVYLATRPYATVWVNVTLQRDNVPMRATVTDAFTHLPIAGAFVSFYWTLGTNYGTTNATGIAIVSVAGGLDVNVYAWATGYLSWSAPFPAASASADLSIQLYPSRTANVTVQGYVRDAVSNAAITFALVQITGYGNLILSDYTDGTGFYQITTVTYPQNVSATTSGYAPGTVSINPAPGSTIWVNLSLSLDSVAPQILNFTATPASNLGPSNPTSLVGQVNETNFARASISILMLRSTSSGIGTFVNMGALPSQTVSVSYPTPGNETVSAAWNTRTAAILLSDGVSAEWWPASLTYQPYLIALSGLWDNATLSTATGGTAYIDSRTGNLLYVYTGYGFISPQDQPTSTFQPYAGGTLVNLATGAVVGGSTVTGSAYELGTFHVTYSSTVPGGQYAGLLETWDAGGRYASRATLVQVTADTTPPVAVAGPNQVVDQGTPVSFNGTASTDNTGIVNYTWTFTDGTAQAVYGMIVTYTFQTPGVRVVTLTVRDAAGNQGTSTLTVTVRDIVAPTVSITAPAEAANVSGSVTLSATATDNVGVARVEFRIDGNLVGNITSAPFQLPLNTATLTNGAHTITATAFDAAGNSATATVHVTVFNTAGAGSGGLLGVDLTIWLALVVVVAGAAIGIVLILLRRRKHRAPRDPPPIPPPMT